MYKKELEIPVDNFFLFVCSVVQARTVRLTAKLWQQGDLFFDNLWIICHLIVWNVCAKAKSTKLLHFAFLQLKFRLLCVCVCYLHLSFIHSFIHSSSASTTQIPVAETIATYASTSKICMINKIERIYSKTKTKRTE